MISRAIIDKWDLYRRRKSRPSSHELYMRKKSQPSSYDLYMQTDESKGGVIDFTDDDAIQEQSQPSHAQYEQAAADMTAAMKSNALIDQLAQQRDAEIAEHAFYSQETPTIMNLPQEYPMAERNDRLASYEQAAKDLSESFTIEKQNPVYVRDANDGWSNVYDIPTIQSDQSEFLAEARLRRAQQKK